MIALNIKGDVFWGWLLGFIGKGAIASRFYDEKLLLILSQKERGLITGIF